MINKINGERMKKELVVFVLVMLIPVASAGTISVTTSVTTETITNRTGGVNIRLLNSGDESSHNTQISLLSTDYSMETIYVGVLQPNIPFEKNISVNVARELLPGTYPFTIRVDYTDANGYPFSAVSPATVVYKTPTSSGVTGVVKDVNLFEKGEETLAISVRNLDDSEHEVKVNVILPRELKVDTTSKTIKIGGKNEETLNFKLSNFGGLVGSSYVILANIEYEDKQLHYSTFGRGIARILEKKSGISLPFSLSKWHYAVILGILVIVFVAYQLRGRKVIITTDRNKGKQHE